jgi:hypothetical protein
MCLIHVPQGLLLFGAIWRDMARYGAKWREIDSARYGAMWREIESARYGAIWRDMILILFWTFPAILRLFFSNFKKIKINKNIDHSLLYTLNLAFTIRDVAEACHYKQSGKENRDAVPMNTKYIDARGHLCV